MNKANFFRILVVLLCAATVASCHRPKSGVTPGPVVSGSARERFESVVEGYGAWSDVSVPVNIKVTSPASVSVSGRVKMVRGRSVDISVRMLGFEVGRIYATNDSVFAMIKPSKVYMAESMGDIFPGMPFDIGNLQDLLLGRMFIMGEGPLARNDYRDFALTLTTDGWEAIPNKFPPRAEYGFMMGPENLLRNFGLAVDGKIAAKCDYSEPYQSEERGVLPRMLSILSRNGSRTVADGSLTWKWENSSWNEGVEDSWSAPRGYKRVKGADLVKGMKL